MAIHTTIASWRSELEQRKRQTQDSFATTVIKIATLVGTRIINRTPLLTGRASGSWKVSVGSPIAADIGPGQHTGAKEMAIAEMVATLNESVSRVAPFRKVYFNNTVPYIDVLERGHSTQAPAGMVRISMIEVRSQLRSRL